MIKILFICHGNICRSPMAEFVFRQMAEQEEMADRFDVASAATTDEEIWNGCGNPVYPPVERLLREHGMNPDGKRARLRIIIFMIISLAWMMRTCGIWSGFFTAIRIINARFSWIIRKIPVPWPTRGIRGISSGPGMMSMKAAGGCWIH